VSSAAFDARRFVQAAGPRPVLRLVVADPAGTVGSALLRELAPELVVVPAGTGAAALAGADEAPGLPWALLASAGGAPGGPGGSGGSGGPSVLAAAVHAARTGPPPAHLLLCPGPGPLGQGPDADLGHRHGPAGDTDAAPPLPCPVTVLLAEDLGPGGTGAAVAAWRRLSPDAFTVRLLGPDAWGAGGSAAVTARVIKEELRVWPA
jgi:hypothetical protein